MNLLEIYSIRELHRWLQKEENIVIYGAGDYGKRIIDYLFFIKEDLKIKGIVVTKRENEGEYKGIRVWTAIDFLNNYKECTVIIAVSAIYQKDIVQIVKQYGRQYCCMTSELYYEIKKRMMDPRPLVSYSGADFLCAGFGKCGTTSLYSALKMVDKIYLSEPKENHYVQWCDKVINAEQLLIENFFDNIREGQKVGIIDPTYAWEANKVYDLLGDETKIIFMVRNPVDAAFSGFKMAARQGRADLDLAYQKNQGIFSVEIFEEHFKRDRDRFKFIDWIKQYEKYYSKKQIKIVFLEELVHWPQAVINDILDFIGISDRYEHEKLPLSNEGGYVMADLEGYKLARMRLREKEANWDSILRDARKRKQTDAELEERYAHAPKIYNIMITAEQRRKTEIYYNSSVRELEKWLDIDLSQIWF